MNLQSENQMERGRDRENENQKYLDASSKVTSGEWGVCAICYPCKGVVTRHSEALADEMVSLGLP